MAKLENNWIRIVQEALDDNRIQMFYQPIIDVKTEKIYKYESLVRLIAKNGDIVSPIQFLPYIKDNLIHDILTKFIIKTVFNKIIDSKMIISINLHLNDLIVHEDYILNYIKNNHVLQNHLIIEILEDDINEKIIFNCTAIVSVLQSLGVMISIDDFGVKSSNYQRVIRLNPNIIKIDGFLMKESINNDLAYSIIESIVHIANNHNIKIVVEFVENANIFNLVKKLEVDYAQGYYFSKPLHENDIKW